MTGWKPVGGAVTEVDEVCQNTGIVERDEVARLAGDEVDLRLAVGQPPRARSDYAAVTTGHENIADHASRSGRRMRPSSLCRDTIAWISAPLRTASAMRRATSPIEASWKAKATHSSSTPEAMSATPAVPPGTACPDG